MTISTTNSTVTAVINSLEAGKTFIHRVRAQNSNGVSIPSNQVSTTVLDRRPDKPTNLRYGFIVGNRGIWLAWNIADGSTGYKAIISDSPKFDQSREIELNRTRVEITGLKFKKVYFLRVVATNGFGNTISEEVVTTANMPPPKHWWGHQSDHKVRYKKGTINNTYVEDSIEPAVNEWNSAIGSLNKGLRICPDCGDSYTVTVKTVNNKNDSTDRIGNHDPKEGCGSARVCIKHIGNGGKNNTTTAPDSHMQNMYIVFEDPPMSYEYNKEEGWHHDMWVWTDDKNSDKEEVDGTDPVSYYAYVGTAMLHEFGHTLGLPNFYGDNSMNHLEAAMNDGDKVGDQDIEQLRAIYSLHTPHKSE